MLSMGGVRCGGFFYVDTVKLSINFESSFVIYLLPKKIHRSDNWEFHPPFHVARHSRPVNGFPGRTEKLRSKPFLPVISRKRAEFPVEHPWNKYKLMNTFSTFFMLSLKLKEYCEDHSVGDFLMFMKVCISENIFFFALQASTDALGDEITEHASFKELCIMSLRSCLLLVSSHRIVSQHALWTRLHYEGDENGKRTLLKNLIFSIHELNRINHRHVCVFIAICAVWKKVFDVYRRKEGKA